VSVVYIYGVGNIIISNEHVVVVLFFDQKNEQMAGANIFIFSNFGAI
jgi:hypothetical protein